MRGNRKVVKEGVAWMINSRIIRPAGGAEFRAKQMRPGCVGAWTQSNRGISIGDEYKKIQQAIPMQAIWDLKYKPGKKLKKVKK